MRDRDNRDSSGWSGDSITDRSNGNGGDEEEEDEVGEEEEEDDEV